jgi:DNA-binding CsgD family transcriptional regulator
LIAKGFPLIDRFIEVSLSCKSQDELFVAFRAAMGELGFDRLIVSLMTDHTRFGLNAQHGIVGNYPADWMQFYVASGYEELDPVRQWVVTADGPFAWRDPARNGLLSRIQRNLLHEAEDAGLKDGVGIPLRGAHGALAGVGAASSVGRLSLTPTIMAHAQLIAHQYYAAYLTLHSAKRRVSPVLLSTHEREVLKWSAEGKSKREIAAILGVSRHTVDYHCRRLLERLDVPNVTAALMRAVQMGALQL